VVGNKGRLSDRNAKENGIESTSLGNPKREIKKINATMRRVAKRAFRLRKNSAQLGSHKY